MVEPQEPGKAPGVRRYLRDHGLLFTNLALFLFFLVGMTLAGVNAYNADPLERGSPAVSLPG